MTHSNFDAIAQQHGFPAGLQDREILIGPSAYKLREMIQNARGLVIHAARVPDGKIFRVTQKQLADALLPVGEIAERAKKDATDAFNLHASRLGIPAAALGFQFNHAGKEFRIAGLNPKRRSHPVLAEAIDGSKKIALSVDSLKALMTPRSQPSGAGSIEPRREWAFYCGECERLLWYRIHDAALLKHGEADRECPNCYGDLEDPSTKHFRGAARARALACGQLTADGTIAPFPLASTSSFSKPLARPKKERHVHRAVGPDGKPLAEAFFDVTNRIIDELVLAGVKILRVDNAFAPDCEDTVEFTPEFYLAVGSVQDCSDRGLSAVLQGPRRKGASSYDRTLQMWAFVETYRPDELTKLAKDIACKLPASAKGTSSQDHTPASDSRQSIARG